MNSWNPLAEILGLLAIAFFFALLAIRLRQKAIVGYLLAGVLVGPRSLALIRSVDTVQLLAELGVALLLFTIGLEFSWQKLAALGKPTLAAGLAQLLVTILAGAALSKAWGLRTESSFVFGAILALSSTAVVLRSLADRAELDSAHGRVLLGILLLQDIALVPLLVLNSVLAEGKQGWQSAAELGLGLVKAGLLFALFYLAIRLVLPKTFSAKTFAERDLTVLLAVVVAVGGAWAAHAAGLSLALGSFLSGLLLADQPAAAQIRADLIPLRSVFVTLFFTSIGMLATVPRASALVTLVLLAAGIIGSKAVLAALSIRLSGAPFSTAARSAVALSQIGEFSFVLAQDGLKRGLLPPEAFDPIVSASVITLLATPYLIGLGPRIGVWASQFSAVAADAADQTAAPQPEVIVVGFGPAGQKVVDALVRRNVRVLVLEMNPSTVGELGGHVPIQLGDATSREILLHAGIGAAKAIIVTVPDPGAARTILSQAKALAPDVIPVVRARYHIYAEPLRRAGAMVVVDEEDTVGAHLAEQAVALLAPEPQS